MNNNVLCNKINLKKKKKKLKVVKGNLFYQIFRKASVIKYKDIVLIYN